MAGVRWLGMGLLVAATALGCGRTSLQEGPPATLAIAFTPAASPAPAESSAPSASVIVWDEGRTLRLNLTGQGFTAGRGAYGAQPLSAYAAGSPPLSVRAADSVPEPLYVQADGSVQLITTFQTRGFGRDWIGFGIFWHPDGDVTNLGGGQLVLFAPLPAETI